MDTCSSVQNSQIRHWILEGVTKGAILYAGRPCFAPKSNIFRQRILSISRKEFMMISMSASSSSTPNRWHSLKYARRMSRYSISQGVPGANAFSIPGTRYLSARCPDSDSYTSSACVGFILNLSLLSVNIRTLCRIAFYGDNEKKSSAKAVWA